MKTAVVVAATLAVLSAANEAVLKKRQSANDLMRGTCKQIIFIFARGSTEPGNMVRSGHIEAQPRLTMAQGSNNRWIRLRRSEGETSRQGRLPRGRRTVQGSAERQRKSERNKPRRHCGGRQDVSDSGPEMSSVRHSLRRLQVRSLLGKNSAG